MPLTTRSTWAAATLAALATPQAQSAWTEKAYAVPSRPGVEVTFVVSLDKEITDGNAVKNMVVLFSGGAGAIASPVAGTREQAPGNLQSLRGLMAEKLGAAISIGLPSDQPRGLSLEWRETDEHVKDAGAVLEVMAKHYPAARITVLGFSNGARSAAHFGAVMAGKMADKWRPRMQGVVLMSTSMEAYRGEWMRALEGSKDRQKVPVLVVQHKRDSCLPYNEIEAEAKWHDFISVEDVKQPRVNTSLANARRDCGNGSAHQFSGREDWVYQAVVDWIKTGKVTELSN